MLDSIPKLIKGFPQMLWPFGLILLFSAPFWTCRTAPDFPIEPVITFKSLTKNVVKQSTLEKDSFRVTFSFTDGDGDISFDDDSKSIILEDSRDSNLIAEFGLPYIGTQGVGRGISGDITLLVYSPCCTFITGDGIKLSCNTVPVTLDTFSYYITLKDRAGNVSNRIQTEPIVLICKE